MRAATTAVAAMLAVTALSTVTACSSEPDFEPKAAEPDPAAAMPAAVEGPFPVTRVVDGDTVRVLIDGQDTSVRLIGIDTPETVAPNRPVECAGPEASVYAEQLMSGQEVFLELDATQGAYDNYGRVLAYVWIADSRQDAGAVMVNLAQVQAGLAEEYTYDDSYKYQQLFQDAEQQAQDDLLGQWGQIC